MTTTRTEQHLKALESANRIRLGRAKLKRRVAAGEVAAADVLSDIPEVARSMSIMELLMSQRRWGRARCRRVLLSLGLSETKQLQSLTPRQRDALVDRLVNGPPPMMVWHGEPIPDPIYGATYGGCVAHVRDPENTSRSLCGEDLVLDAQYGDRRACRLCEASLELRNGSVQAA